MAIGNVAYDFRSLFSFFLIFLSLIQKSSSVPMRAFLSSTLSFPPKRAKDGAHIGETGVSLPRSMFLATFLHISLSLYLFVSIHPSLSHTHTHYSLPRLISSKSSVPFFAFYVAGLSLNQPRLRSNKI